MQRLPGSPVEWHETDQELVLHLPRRVGRMMRPLLAIALFFSPFVLVGAFTFDGWLPAVLGVVAVPASLLCIAYAQLRTAYLTDFHVTISPENAVVKSQLGGRTTSKHFALKPRSRAWQWYLRWNMGQNSAPQGIVIADPSYDQEAGELTNDQSKPRLGGNQTPGEMDWVEWRINLFLDRHGHAAPPQPEAEEGPRAPQEGLIQIRDNGFETEILFPNTVATGSFTGTWVLFIGLVLLTLACVPLLIIWRDAERLDWPELLKMLALLAVFGILGLAGASNGLTQLFGRRQLTISPWIVRYSARVLGMSVWWTLPTGDIVSVWDPSKRQPAHRPNRAIASADLPVIRTPRRQLPLRAVQDAVSSGAGAQWLADQISDRIVAVRHRGAVGDAVPSGNT